MERLQKLRSRVFETSLFSNEFHYLFYKEYERLSALSENERYAEALYFAFSNLTPSISEGELIVGKRDIPLSAEAQKEWDNIYLPIAQARQDKAGGGQHSHMAIDYELVLSKGIYGIIDSIDTHMQTCDAEKIAFYACCKRCLQAVIKHAENYADCALKISEETADPFRQKELEKIAQVCKKVPAQPAESFYEAVQSVHFISHCISLYPFKRNYQQFQLGHPDRYLLPYYAKDIQNGVITRQYAQLLLDCLGIQINMRVPNGLSSGYMVGGRDSTGNIVENELTEMCMQVVDDIRLVYPAVGLCYAEGMSDRCLDQAVELLSKGYSHPAIFNDDTITQGLLHYGIDEEQAHNYIHSTCVEITPVAASNVWVASPYTNLVQLLLDIMDQEYPCFDDLIKAYFNKLDSSIKSNFEAQNNTRATRAANAINPLLSCFVNDCLDRGLDIEQGGAIYNWIMPSFVGMANLIDSFYAINQLVFQEQRLSVCEFKSILDENYASDEPLRQYIQNKIAKYGNDIDDIDRYFVLISEHIADECMKYQGMYTNGNVIPSVFCWVKHEHFGRETSATPDGRKAGFPLGDGSGPCQGREMNGPTASILSSTKWDHHRFIGGVAVNLKFSKAAMGNHSSKTMKNIIKTYLKRGGFEVQINVVDNETLKKARVRPEEYRDLVVRIGGYSDYFVKLSPQMQEELILRTTHNV